MCIVKNAMKNILNLLRKIDRGILNLLTNIVRKWIKKHDYKKHKVDYTINVRKLTLALLFSFALLAPAIIFLMQGKYLNAGFHVSIWSVSVGIAYWRLLKMVREEKPIHDVLFSLRKNPQVYNMEKEVLEFVFIATRRTRVSVAVFTLLIEWFFAVALVLIYFTAPVPVTTLPLAVFFFINPFLSTTEQYLFYVFDFDEPEEKKKVAKENISEIFLRAWQNLIGGLAPQPNYG